MSMKPVLAALAVTASLSACTLEDGSRDEITEEHEAAALPEQGGERAKYGLQDALEASAEIPDAVFRGCYTGITAYYDCDIAGYSGVYQGLWSWYICDSRYCSSGFGLVTDR